jgi:hypothetical protein
VREEDLTLESISATFRDVRMTYALALDLAHPDYDFDSSSARGSTFPRGRSTSRALYVRPRDRLLVSHLSLDSPLDILLGIPIAATIWTTAQLVEFVYNLPLRRRLLEAQVVNAELDVEERLKRKGREETLERLRERTLLTLVQADLQVNPAAGNDNSTLSGR